MAFFLCLALPGALAGALGAPASAANPPDPALIARVAQSRYWKLLLHYRKGYWGSEQSEADGSGFFFSPAGRTDPEAELLATLQAFRSDKKISVQTHLETAQCAFPERFRFLRQELALEIPVQPCADFLEWKSRFHARSVILVYAAPYLGSPASMFGHTFLRVDSTSAIGTAKNPRLDRAISFEAFTGGDGGAGYVIKGLMGGYPGVFSLHPYYLKINAYNDIESRDLWEYEINLTAEQVDRLLNHAWEMGTTYFNYYFFNRNCSYHLLSLLEVANPDWHLREHFSIMTIPADTIRALSKIPGAIKRRTFRPALLKILETRLSHMSSREKTDFFRLQGKSESYGPELSPQTLDALLDWQKYEVMNRSKTVLDPDQQVDLSLLKARAQAGGEVLSEQAAVSELEQNSGSQPPESGHLSTKMTFGVGVETGSGLGELGFRPVLHDFADADGGYLPHSRLLILDTLLDYRLRSPGTLRLEKLTLAQVTNLSPWTPLHHGFSWDAGAGFYHPEDVGCPGCVAGRLRGGLGVTFAPLPHIVTTYALVHLQLEGSDSFTPFFRLGPSGELGALMDLSERSKIALGYEYFKYFEAASVPRRNWFVTSAQANYALSERWNLEIRGELYSLVQNNHARAVFSTGWYF